MIFVYNDINMNLLLTSAGLGNEKIKDFFVEKLLEGEKELSDCSVLMVAYAQNKDEQFYVDQSKSELVDIGIGDITVFNLTEEKFLADKKYDVVYVCGGNTFSILERMRITGIDKYIKKEVIENNMLYVGVSAGSIIAGPNVEIAGWGSEGDPNDVGLTDLSGFNFTDIAVFPHFRPELSDEVSDFQKKVSYPVIALTNDEAILVDSAEHKKI